MERESELLCVADVASELSIKPIEALRLIARRNLPAGPVGDESYRVGTDDLAKYVRDGAKDLRFPPVEQLGVYVQRFEDGLSAELKKQIPNDEQLKALVAKSPNILIFEGQGKLTPAMSAAIAQKPTKGSFDPSPKTVERFGSWGDLYAVAKIRAAVSYLYGNGWQQKLYESPIAYDKLLVETWKQVLNGNIVARDWRVLPDGEQSMRVSFTVNLPLSTFIDGARLTRASALAF